MRTRLLILSMVLITTAPAAIRAADTDGDGLDDAVDNCIEVANDQCDTDGDGFGNACDADIDQDGAVSSTDVSAFSDALAAEDPSADINCDGAVDFVDTNAFAALFQSAGAPGPSGLLCAPSEGCIDEDHDGTAVARDSCTGVANDPTCDADGDGYGNACDADYNQDGASNFVDVPFLQADLTAGVDSGVGTDHNCDGAVNSSDVAAFQAQLSQGAPGPSGLACAGTVPCLVDVTEAIAFAEPFGILLGETATDGQGRIHGVYAGRSDPEVLVYFTQSDPGAPFTSETIAVLATDERVDMGLTDLALDGDGDPCIAWGKAFGPGSEREVQYGCRDASGFAFAEIGPCPFDPSDPADDGPCLRQSVGDLHLALDSQDRAHVSFYQHLPLETSPNHRARHVWFDGTSWQKQNVLLPPAYQALGGGALSSGACLAIDGSDRVHFVFGVSLDTSDNAATDPDPEDWLGALAHATWSSGSGWEDSAVIREEAAGDLSPTEKATGCEIAVAGDGSVRVAYQAGTGSEYHVFYGSNAGTAWSYTDLGAGSDPGSLAIDGAGDAFVLMRLASVEWSISDLVRIGASGAVDRWSLSPPAASGSGSVWSPPLGDTECRALRTRFFLPQETQVVLASVHACGEP